MGLFLLIPNFIYPLFLSLSQFEEKRKKRKEERHLCSWTIHLWYIWHVECVYLCVVKNWYFNVPTCLKLLFAASATNLLYHISFSASIRPMICSLKIVILIPLKFLYEELELPTTIINIITSKPRGPYLPLF